MAVRFYRNSVLCNGYYSGIGSVVTDYAKLTPAEKQQVMLLNATDTTTTKIQRSLVAQLPGVGSKRSYPDNNVSYWLDKDYRN
jgi:hypothetical protein